MSGELHMVESLSRAALSLSQAVEAERNHNPGGGLVSELRSTLSAVLKRIQKCTEGEKDGE